MTNLAYLAVRRLPTSQGCTPEGMLATTEALEAPGTSDSMKTTATPNASTVISSLPDGSWTIELDSLRGLVKKRSKP